MIIFKLQIDIKSQIPKIINDIIISKSNQKKEKIILMYIIIQQHGKISLSQLMKNFIYLIIIIKF